MESLVTAFTLFRVQGGSSDLVCYNLTQISHVQEVYVVYGNYDIIAKVEAGTMRELQHILTHLIRRMENIRSTRTMIVIDG